MLGVALDSGCACVSGLVSFLTAAGCSRNATWNWKLWKSFTAFFWWEVHLSPHELFRSLGWRIWQEFSCKVKLPLLILEAAPSLHGVSGFWAMLLLPVPCIPLTVLHPGRGLYPPPWENQKVCMHKETCGGRPNVSFSIKLILSVWIFLFALHFSISLKVQVIAGRAISVELGRE